ncbi:MAG: HAMP domain-containing protein, partial [Candidatus Desulfatibia sp.]|uniref:HAMP domain-containing protein n=1 Tax=Candidatus Desulfatibia sp. TaxID=3101189 RepID=UPI002F30E22D
MKIKSKFQIITVLSIVIGLMIAFTLFIHIQDMRAAIEEDDKVDQLTSGVFDLNLLTNDYLLNRTERTQMQWQLRYDSLTELIHNMKFRIKEEQLLQKEILHNHDRLKVIFSRIIANYASRKNSSEMPAELSELEDRLVGKLLTNSQTMVSSAGQLIEISHRRLVSAQRKSSLVVILLVILITVIIAANSFFTRKSIIVPISKLQKGTQTIGEGDLNFKIASVAKDEIGGLSRAFDHMTEKLKAITVSRDKLEDEINERKQAEEALIKSETFLNATGQIAKVGGWQIDGETKKVFWTKEIYNITEVPNDYDPS